MGTAIDAEAFKAKCLQLLDEVAEHRVPLIITKRGIPIAKLVPVVEEHKMFGSLKGSVVGEGDIITPVGAEW